MSPLTEVGLVAARELRRNLRSAKGLALLGLSALAALGATLLVVRGEQLAAQTIGEQN